MVRWFGVKKVGMVGMREGKIRLRQQLASMFAQDLP